MTKKWSLSDKGSRLNMCNVISGNFSHWWCSDQLPREAYTFEHILVVLSFHGKWAQTWETNGKARASKNSFENILTRCRCILSENCAVLRFKTFLGIVRKVFSFKNYSAEAFDIYKLQVSFKTLSLAFCSILRIFWSDSYLWSDSCR